METGESLPRKKRPTLHHILSQLNPVYTLILPL